MEIINTYNEESRKRVSEITDLKLRPIHSEPNALRS
jgi:hypothetical protein